MTTYMSSYPTTLEGESVFLLLCGYVSEIYPISTIASTFIVCKFLTRTYIQYAAFEVVSPFCSAMFTLQGTSQGFFFLLLFGLRLYVPLNNFSFMSGRSHCFLCITSTVWEVNVSCSRIQHGDPSEDRTPDLSLRSPTLYH